VSTRQFPATATGPARLAAVATAAALLVLSGCSDNPSPGAASVVDGHKISNSQVTELSDAQCAGVQLAAKQGQGQPVSRKQLTQRALGLLIDIRLNLDYGKSLGLTPRSEQAQADFAQVKPLIASLPAKYHTYLDSVFEQWADGRDLMTQVGEQSSGQQATSANAEQVLDAGYKQRQTWLVKNASIETDARYAPGKIGWPGEGDSSVSEPESSYAKAAAKATPSASFLGNLPSGQRCG
jgi:hypothetical protein